MNRNLLRGVGDATSERLTGRPEGILPVLAAIPCCCVRAAAFG